jgi:hypothetical protein
MEGRGMHPILKAGQGAASQLAAQDAATKSYAKCNSKKLLGNNICEMIEVENMKQRRPKRAICIGWAGGCDCGWRSLYERGRRLSCETRRNINEDTKRGAVKVHGCCFAKKKQSHVAT